MPMQPREFRGLNKVSLGTLATTGTAETLRAVAPSGLNGPFLQAQNLTGYVNIAEVWRPVGITYIIGTGITVTAAVVQLWKNGATVGAGGAITLPIASSGPNHIFAPFGNYAPGTDAAGDNWSLKVTTSSTAGSVTIDLWYATKQVTGINEGVSV